MNEEHLEHTRTFCLVGVCSKRSSFSQSACVIILYIVYFWNILHRQNDATKMPVPDTVAVRALVPWTA